MKNNRTGNLLLFVLCVSRPDSARRTRTNVDLEQLRHPDMIDLLFMSCPPSDPTHLHFFYVCCLSFVPL